MKKKIPLNQYTFAFHIYCHLQFLIRRLRKINNYSNIVKFITDQFYLSVLPHLLYFYKHIINYSNIKILIGD